MFPHPSTTRTLMTPKHYSELSEGNMTNHTFDEDIHTMYMEAQCNSIKISL